MVKSSPEQSTKKLISVAMDSHTKIVPPVKSFTLKSSSSDFASRSLSIFSTLNTLESNHQTWMSHNETLESFEEEDKIIEPVPNSPDVFKKPFAPLPLKRKAVISRNKRNRKRWIKYSLEDIPLSSDATNSTVAFQFLRELRKKKEEEAAVSSSDDKVIFCKPMAPKNYLKKNVTLCSMSANDDNSDQDSQSFETVSCEEGKCVAPSVKLMHLEDEFDDV